MLWLHFNSKLKEIREEGLDSNIVVNLAADRQRNDDLTSLNRPREERSQQQLIPIWWDKTLTKRPYMKVSWHRRHVLMQTDIYLCQGPPRQKHKPQLSQGQWNIQTKEIIQKSPHLP